MNTDARIFIAGARNLIGAAIVRQFKTQGFSNVFDDMNVDLANLADLNVFFHEVKPQFIVDAGGSSGGISANQKFPADLMVDNLLRATNLIYAAHTHSSTKLLYLASSCSYPRESPQPMRPEYLLTGPLEATNEAYAVAKIAGIKLCQSYRGQYGHDFIVGIPANSFGPGDDFSLDDSHVIGALIRKMHDAKVRKDRSVVVWGTGAPRRDFIFVDDLADASIFALRHYTGPIPLNLGSDESISIAELADMIRTVVGFEGEIEFDRLKPDGMPVKSLDSSSLRNLGWRPRMTLRDGLAATYSSFLVHFEVTRNTN